MTTCVHVCGLSVCVSALCGALLPCSLAVVRCGVDGGDSGDGVVVPRCLLHYYTTALARSVWEGSLIVFCCENYQK